MACCIVAAVLLMMLHRLTPWRRRPEDIATFAPVARRDAPGTVPVLYENPVPAPVPLRRRTALIAWVLWFCSVGACIYLAGVALLLWSGMVHSSAPTTAWVIRTCFVVVVAAIAAMLAKHLLRQGEDQSSRRDILGCATVGIALVAIERTTFEMDLLGLYRAANAVVSYGMHVAAIALLALGVLLALRGQRPVSSPPVPIFGG